MYKRQRLAAVTGRPRRDALELLNRFELTELFEEVITMDDAPAKPNPAPVELALRRLGVRAAWMIGDTVDDIRAARAAHVVPIGVVAPQDRPDETQEHLAQRGAARVIQQLDELLEVLP